MAVTCAAVRLAIDTVGASALSRPLAFHADHCEGCAQAMATSMRLRDGLAGLDPVEFRAPESIHPRVMSSLGPVVVPDLAERHLLRVPVAAAVVATAAAGTAVILHLRRTRAA
jgi:hypothetical protein